MARKFSAVKQVKAMARERIGAPRPGQRINDDLRCRYCRQDPPCMCDEGAEREERLGLGECDECGQPMHQDNDGVVYCLECSLEEAKSRLEDAKRCPRISAINRRIDEEYAARELADEIDEAIRRME